jgi:hypothetical protein
MNDDTKKEKTTVRIRRAEFAGAEDKFYAPADDIRQCYRPIVRGGIQAAAEAHPELNEDLVRCAQAYGEYNQAAFLSEDKVDVLVKKLYDSLASIDQHAVSVCADFITRSMLTYYGVAQRETSGHVDLVKPKIEKIAAIGSFLSTLSKEDRETVVEILEKKRQYPEELDREPQEGVIFEREDSKNKEEAG